MAGLKFAPDALVVPRGTTVLFDNNDVAPHTVTSQDGSIDSGILRPGATFSLVVNTRFEYFCAIHPSMEASIEIEG
jgi:plastocyanin